MNFKPAPITINFSYRLISEGEKWEIGLIPQLFNNWDVGFNPIGSDFTTIRYSCGCDTQFIFLVLATLLDILKSYPETVSEKQLQKDFPAWKVRPIDKDACWPQLQAMANRVRGIGKVVGI